MTEPGFEKSRSYLLVLSVLVTLAILHGGKPPLKTVNRRGRKGGNDRVFGGYYFPAGCNKRGALTHLISRRRYATTPASNRYVSPLANSAQMIRAFLFATATAALL